MTDDGYLKVTPELWLALGQHLSDRNEMIRQRWQPIGSMPSPAQHGRTMGICTDSDKLVYWKDGAPIAWMPLPPPPPGESNS